jgi:hypothetical protein
MKFTNLTGLAAVAVVSFAGAAQAADTVTFNSAPTDTWYFGDGNDYTPANTVVLTTEAGDQLYLRAHQTRLPAPASTGNVYSFATGLVNGDFPADTGQLSFDWGFDSHTGSADGLTASITLTNLAGGSFSYDALFAGNDNELQDGSTQNSFRFNWAPIGFDPNADGSYTVQLTVNGLDGGARSLDIRADIGNGFSAAVPEPASWALMIAGFGGLGVMLRRRRSLCLTA